MPSVILKTPLAPLLIVEQEQKICQISFTDKETSFVQEPTPLLQTACCQLEEYFLGLRKNFNLPLCLSGTPFQQQVWKILQTIPYGQTICYQDIATFIGKPKACRAVGMANHKNPLAIVVPCHRVVGKNGSLVDYEVGVILKKQLLELEQKFL